MTEGSPTRVLKNKVLDPGVEAELVSKAITGDVNAFGELYCQFRDPVYGYSLYRTHSEFDAEDITQQVFLGAWRTMGRYQITNAPIAAWFFTIAHNVLVSHYRREARTPLPLTEDIDIEDQRESVDPEALAIKSLQAERIREVVDSLPPHYRDLIYDRFINDLGPSEIAANAGKKSGAVRVMQLRAIRILQKKFNGSAIV